MSYTSLLELPIYNQYLFSYMNWFCFSNNSFQHLTLHCRTMILRFMIMILINTGKHFGFQMILLLNMAGGILKSWRLIHQDLESWQLLWATLVVLMTKRRWLLFRRSLSSIFFCSSFLKYLSFSCCTVYFCVVISHFFFFWGLERC